MKSLKALGFVTVILVCILLLCSCTCDPSQYQWDIGAIRYYVKSANGQTLRTTTTSSVFSLQPVGISSDDINITFFEDGRVEFKPYKSTVLYGTYTFDHNGMKDTSFTVEFENGERIEDGYAVSYYGGRDIFFSFRGVNYEFGDTSHYTRTDEEIHEDTQWLIKEIREVGNYFYRGTVTLDGEGGKLSSEDLEEDIDLFAEGRLVTAVHISDNNELTVINELRDGECVFAYNNSKYDSQVVVYYVDPLPEDLLPEEPREYTIFEVIPELEYYMNNPENAVLKLTREHKPALAGEFNEHLYKTEADDLAFWLERLSEITLIESDSPPYDVDEQHIKYTMRFEDKTEENSRVIIYYECGMIRRGDKWYDCSTFPNWYGGRPVYSFSCMNYSMYVWGGGIRYFAIDGIEFEPDKKQDYEYPEEHWTLRLEGDVGEIIVYDETHFYYNGTYYIVTSEKNFAYIYS